MAQIDVTELFSDPDFVDVLSIIPRTTTINSKGENILVEGTPVMTQGSVQPINGRDLRRLPDELQIADVRSFYIKAEISADGSGNYPDILSFNGKRFQIKTANAWMNWGAGWSKGICVAELPAA